jgi:hypothetical protein
MSRARLLAPETERFVDLSPRPPVVDAEAAIVGVPDYVQQWQAADRVGEAA